MATGSAPAGTDATEGSSAAGLPGASAGRKLVLFDVDGTVLDANQSIRQTMNHVLAEFRQPTFKHDELQRLIGHPLRWILRQKATDVDDATLERMAHRYRAIYGESGWVTARPFPGIEACVASLRARGIATGIVTSKGETEAETALFDLGLLHLFDTVVGDDDVRPLKPHPAPVLEGCRRMGTAVEDTAMVGDTHFDAECARAAGALAVGVLWGNGSRDSLQKAGAHVVVANARELERVLLRWAPR